MEQRDYSHHIFLLLMIITFIIVATVLKLTASFFVPVTISVLIAFVFFPFLKKMHESKIKVPWILGIIIVVLIAIFFFFILGNLLVASFKTILQSLPKYEARFTVITNTFLEKFKLSDLEKSEILAKFFSTSEINSLLKNSILSISNYILNSGKNILLISLFVVFLLIEMKNLYPKVLNAFPEGRTSKKIIIIATKIISQVTHFISIKFLVSLITGFLVYLVCAIVKMDFAILWGFFAFILNFIPNFGSIISWAITSVFAILQFYPHAAIPVTVSVLVLAINMIFGNIVEPRWEGEDLGLSPFVILVSLSLWTWLWGFVGAILAVPLTVIIKIICENIEFLKPVAVLMGTSSKRKRKHL